MRVAIVHYDISMRTGAQRLVLGLGDSIKRLGHEVAYFTSIYDEHTAFDEFSNEMVFVSGGRREILGRFRGLTAFLGSKSMIRYGIKRFSPEIFVFSSNYYLASEFRPSIIYCHHPEMLLVKRRDWIRRALHYPIDSSEKRGFDVADAIVCNSSFTRQAVEEAFGRRGTIAYPGVDLQKFMYSKDDDHFILTVNRIMPNKYLELAIDSIDILKNTGISVSLVIAGSVQLGFEWYLESLRQRVESMNLDDNVSIKPNLADDELLDLYRRCSIFLYTPLGEHYGFGPVEAMASGKLVIAAPGGGPSETVLDGETGFIVPANPEDWALKIKELWSDPDRRALMGKKARLRVEEGFTWEQFSKTIGQVMNRTIKSRIP